MLHFNPKSDLDRISLHNFETEFGIIKYCGTHNIKLFKVYEVIL